MRGKSQIIEELSSIGHLPNRQLGQNFLIDGNVVKLAIRWAKIQPGNQIVEIGPGLGSITAELLAAGAIVHAVEIDGVLLDKLREKFSAFLGNSLYLLHGDAVKFPLAGVDDGTAGAKGAKVIANLPYAISTPWMESLLQGPLPQSMTLLLQSEAAQRLTAQAHPRYVGAIGIRLRSAYDLCCSRRVAPTCFYPIPRVNSTLIHIERKEKPFLFSQPCYQTIRLLFLHRRKQMQGIIKKYFDDIRRPILIQWLASIGKAAIRAENISMDQWQHLEMLLQR
ncbi:MAG: 16S rRNA (adenine(1518)-N(6)/adenine(1519)-N(6))-dimethyltransferase RsmA [Puniceicoccales bacterium]|jgi:16S rRNA (adenine1518-N6/adenine1519-N6)-dimethyltransferase|nr:16S rRNA (adenine(1518)-N(6)/adenine(1519)-N(6))-dimethyltransferase RsmA [Puniceicoccales bacterium]